jgi:Fe-S-cluster containining protein
MLSVCLRCKAKCCRRYWIYLLKEDADKLASALHMPTKQFVEEYCTALIKAVPCYSPAKICSLAGALLPKRVAKVIRRFFGIVPPYLMFFPAIVLSRTHRRCVFLNDKFLCELYEARPLVCRLFPEKLIMQHHQDTVKRFCPLARNKHLCFSTDHYNRFKHQFDLMLTNGIASQFGTIPHTTVFTMGAHECSLHVEDAHRLFEMLWGKIK